MDAESFDKFLKINHLPKRARECSCPADYWASLAWEEREACGLNAATLEMGYKEYLVGNNTGTWMHVVRSLEILRGCDKDGVPERYDLRFLPGDVVCLVGPTGAGKSRLLADIECLAQRDTPTRRQILIDGKAPDPAKRFSGESGLVAQITQNMNFVMDLPVEDFLLMHAESRDLKDPENVVERVMRTAIGLAGEPFGPKTQITQLSGGQSRALMIADAAFLSPKPVVLIDEIENAGVDRVRALRLFVEKGKIVILSTHDPMLALWGARRLVIRNGAVCAVIEPDKNELALRVQLAELDAELANMRERLRRGERIGCPDTAKCTLM